MKEKYTIEEVFNLLGEENLKRKDARKKKKTNIVVDNFLVYPISLRYITFFNKGVKCVCCGREGSYFKLEKGDRKSPNRRHFNLYTEDGILMTKDHIFPKSKGGKDILDNMQPLCEKCNHIKGDLNISIKQLSLINDIIKGVK